MPVGDDDAAVPGAYEAYIRSKLAFNIASARRQAVTLPIILSLLVAGVALGIVLVAR
jgi:hypothetical protein